MKELKIFINEKLNIYDFAGQTVNEHHLVSKYFNKDCNPTKSRDDVKDGDIIYLLRIDINTHKLIKEYEAKANIGEFANYIVYSHINELPKYLDKWKYNSHPSYEDHKKTFKTTVETLEYNDEEIAFIVWNKENKNTFIKWIESMPDNYFDKIHEEAEKEAKRRKEAERKRQQYWAKKAKSFIPKIPKNLYSDEEAMGTELITRISGELNMSKSIIKTLFKGLESSSFDVIFWNGNSRGYEDAQNAINKLFPGDESYWLYSEKADLWKQFKNNACIAKFITNDNKSICIADSGDDGYVYVCVEN